MKTIYLTKYSYIGVMCVRNEWLFFSAELPVFMLDLTLFSKDEAVMQQYAEERHGIITLNEKTVDIFTINTNVYNLENFDIYIEVGDEFVKSVVDFVINFDKKLFVDGLRDDMLLLFRYVPHGWTAIEDYAINYIPSQFKHKFSYNYYKQ